MVALNVVTAALEADPRTRGLEVVFAKSPAEVATRVAELTARGARALVAWSFYSPDFAAAARDIARVRAAGGAEGALHLAGLISTQAT